jgi:hypothetical protein
MVMRPQHSLEIQKTTVNHGFKQMTHKPKIWHLKLFVFALSFGLFVLSLNLPALTYNEINSNTEPLGINSTYSGIQILAFGTFSLFAPPFLNGISWLSNLILLSAWAKIPFEPDAAVILSLLALIFSNAFLLTSNLPVIIMKDDARGGDIIQLHLGFYLWVLSILVCHLGAALIYILQRKNNS